MQTSGDKDPWREIDREAGRDEADYKHRKARYHRRKAEGLCVQCGRRKAMDGHVRCEECKTRQDALHRAFVEKRMAQRICLRCGVKLKPTEKYRMCFDCRYILNAYYRDRKCKNG